MTPGHCGLSVDDRCVLFQLAVQPFECLFYALASDVIGEEPDKACELTGPTGLQPLRSIPEGRQIHTSQIFHHVGGQRHILVIATPPLYAQATALIGVAVPNGDMCLKLAVVARLERRHEVGLILGAQVAKDIGDVIGPVAPPAFGRWISSVLMRGYGSSCPASKARSASMTAVFPILLAPTRMLSPGSKESVASFSFRKLEIFSVAKCMRCTAIEKISKDIYRLLGYDEFTT